jgi:hypothetical protein
VLKVSSSLSLMLLGDAEKGTELNKS